MITQQKQAVIWGRFSSDKQSDGDSRERQDRLNKATAERLGIKVLAEHFDEAVSVRDGATPRFRQMVADLPKGVGILTESLDRINREHPWKQKAFLYEVISQGHFIITTQDGTEYNTETINQVGTVATADLQTNLGNAENEKRNKRVKEEKTKAIALARQGKPAPLGAWLPSHIKYNFETEKYDVMEERRAIVERIFKAYLKGKGCVSIAKQLNHELIPTFRLKRKWSQSTIWTMLRYEGFIGVLNLNGERMPNAFPSAITEDLFYKVQSLVTQNKTRHGNYTSDKVNNLFRGLCHCAKCGATMRVLTDDYIQCRGNVEGNGCKVKHLVRFSEMEYEFAKWFIPQAKDALLGQDDHQATLKALQGKQDAIQERIKRTVELLDTGLAMSVLKERLGKLESEKASVENEVSELKAKRSSNATMPDTIKQLEKMIEDCQTDQDTRRKVASAIPSLVKDVRIDISDKLFPSFKVELVNGQVLQWQYDVEEFSQEIKGITKDGNWVLGKVKVREGGYKEKAA